MGGTAPGTEHDVLAITGNASLADALRVSRISHDMRGVDDELTILTCTEQCCPADLNGDIVENGGDLGLLLSSWSS